MGGNIMLKAIGRATLVTLIIVLIGFGFWNHTIITIVLVIFAWLVIMFYTDPPEDWDR